MANHPTKVDGSQAESVAAPVDRDVRRLRLPLVWNADSNAYECDAPPGYRFASGPSCLIMPFTSRNPTREERRWAREELRQRVVADELVIDDEE